VSTVFTHDRDYEVPAGLHPDIPFEEYRAWPALSNSTLSLMRRSPLHCRSGFGPATEAMKLGSLAHCALLEPLEIIKRYVFMPNYANHPENTTKDGSRSYSSATTFVKNKEEEFTKLHHDKEIVSEQFYNQVLGMSRAYHRHELTASLIRNAERELSALWWDEELGVWCKARFDVFQNSSDGPRHILDVKSTVDARSFERTIANWGYHRQAAFYLRGMWATTKKVCGGDEFYFTAIEKTEPYGIRTAPMDFEAIQTGNREIRELVALYRECSTNDRWPGYDSPEAWSLPAWYGERAEDSVELMIDGELLEV